MSDLKTYFGVPYSDVIKEDVLKTAIDYIPEEGDIFLATYPKCGTNWTHSIIDLILNKGEPSPLYVGVGDTFFELVGAEWIRNLPKPRVIPTHMQYTMIPKSKLAKYIIVFRNPKDACVSLYNHNIKQPLWGIGEPSFGDFFEVYLRGDVMFGNFFDHLLSWYPHKDDPNVLFLTYEGIKTDTRGAILKIGSFLGEEHRAWLDNDDNLEKVLHKSGLNVLYSRLSTNFQKVEEEIEGILEEGANYSNQGMVKLIQSCNVLVKPNEKKKFLVPGSLVRKGEIGDWRNYFSEEQSKRMEEEFWRRTSNTDIINLWKDIDFISQETS